MKKRVGYAIIGVLLIFSLVACGSDEVEQVETNKTPSGDNVLTMVTSAEFPPFETRDETGEIIGFDIDLANKIAEKLGMELQIEDMKFDGIIGALQAGRADMAIAGMNATEERRENVEFSTEYYSSGQQFITLPENEMTDLDDLNGKTIGVQIGSVQAEGAEKLAEEYDLEIKTLDDVGVVVQELLSNRIDIGYMDKAVAKGYIDSQGLKGFADPTESAPGMAVAFPKDSELVEQVNKIITDLEEEGEIEKLEEKWLSN